MSAVEDLHDPSPAHPPRMQALARLPIFLVLAGKRALVAGNGAPVAWKAELLAAAGADVAVFAERPCEELRTIVAKASRAAITLQHRPRPRSRRRRRQRRQYLRSATPDVAA